MHLLFLCVCIFCMCNCIICVHILCLALQNNFPCAKKYNCHIINRSRCKKFMQLIYDNNNIIVDTVISVLY